jgi:ABC-type antimicrobial peptide transport system ATPase subunit
MENWEQVEDLFSSTFRNLQSCYDVTPKYALIRAILNTSLIVSKPISCLQNSKNCGRSSQIIQDKVNLTINFKVHEDTEPETNNILNLLHHAAKGTTPYSKPQKTTNNITYEINELVTEKGRARSIRQ